MTYLANCVTEKKIQSSQGNVKHTFYYLQMVYFKVLITFDSSTQLTNYRMEGELQTTSNQMRLSLEFPLHNVGVTNTSVTW